MKLLIDVRETIFKQIEIDLDGTDYNQSGAKGKYEIIAEILKFPLKEVTKQELKTADSETVEILSWDIEE